MGTFLRKQLVLFFAVITGFLHAESAAELNNEGARLFESGQYRDAEAPLARAIEIWSFAQPAVADLETALHNLAACYRVQGRFAEAAPLYQRALDLREARTGPTNLSLLSPLTGLGMLYLDRRDLVRAKQITKRALSIAELHTAEHTGESASGFLSLGSLLATQGRYEDARTWIKRALATRRRLFGDMSTESADALVELAVDERRARRFEEASQVYRRALQIYEEKNDVKRVSVMRSLAELLLLSHNDADARRLLERAECILESQPTASALELGRTKASLGNLQLSEKHLAEAAVRYHDALAILELVLGAGNPELLPLLDHYARVLRAGQDYATAAAIDMQAMRIRVRLALLKQG